MKQYNQLAQDIAYTDLEAQYDDCAQPVCSIWLMLSTTGVNANTVTLFSQLQQHSITGNYIRDKRKKNLMNIVMTVCRQKDRQTNPNRPVRLPRCFLIQ